MGAPPFVSGSPARIVDKISRVTHMFELGLRLYSNHRSRQERLKDRAQHRGR